ncbi:MAG: 50S ribosomal protein L18 [Parcubacteria group bacterium]|nr:50S ribosomal protein L18 [Parcubacteria group bacterium]
MQKKREKRYNRHKRIRAKVKGTKSCPRFSVFRSNQHISGQLINDDKGITLISVNDSEIKKGALTNKVEIAYKVGQIIAKKALDKKIGKVVFDRGGYKYHGRVKAMAEGARKEGLKF